MSQLPDDAPPWTGGPVAGGLTAAVWSPRRVARGLECAATRSLSGLPNLAGFCRDSGGIRDKGPNSGSYTPLAPRVNHTTNGNPIDVSDKWNIQTPDTTWPIEAKWGPNGAVCLNTPRKLQWPRESLPCAASLPYCTSDGTVNGTPNTSPSQYGGLLMTRAVPNNNPSAY